MSIWLIMYRIQVGSNFKISFLTAFTPTIYICGMRKYMIVNFWFYPDCRSHNFCMMAYYTKKHAPKRNVPLIILIQFVIFKLLCSWKILSCTCIDLDNLTLVGKQRNIQCCTCLNCTWLCSVCSCISCYARLTLCNLKLYKIQTFNSESGLWIIRDYLQV